MRIRAPTIGLALNFGVAALFDMVSIAMMQYRPFAAHIVVYIVFFLLALSATVYYIRAVRISASESHSHVNYLEDTLLTDINTTIVAFVAFALADVSELLDYIDGCLVATIVFKCIFSFFAFTVSFFGLIVSVIGRQNRFTRLAVEFDTNSKINKLESVMKLAKLAQMRDVYTFVALFWWFVADIADISHFVSDSNTTVNIVVLSLIVVVFVAFSFLAVLYDARLTSHIQIIDGIVERYLIRRIA